MKILISNDDGVRAQGINVLSEELKNGNETIIIAPNKERSSCGHGITLGEPIRVNELENGVFECSGFPADCVLVGIGQILKDSKPDLIVSGINHGANLGQDRFYSGTIAAAREGAFRGIPSIAVSLVTKGIKDIEHFEVAAKFVKKLIDAGIDKLIPEMCVLNINVPNVPPEEIAGIKTTFAGFQEYSEEVIERIDTRGKKYYWVGGTFRGHKELDGSDGTAVDKNFISLNLQDLGGKTYSNLTPLTEFLNKLE